jgi:hypothetical protein
LQFGAVLKIPELYLSGRETGFTVEVFPILTVWEPGNVGWDHPWQTPGGGYDEGSISSVMVPDGSSGAVGIDLSPILTP